MKDKDLKRCGIWIDSRSADIIYTSEGLQHHEITSSIEEFNPKGGSRSKNPYGPMDKMDEKKYLHRKEQQIKAYFEQILSHIGDVDELLLFGPSQTKNQLEQFLQKSSNFNGIIAVETADSITKNQKIAKVKNHFGS